MSPIPPLLEAIRRRRSLERFDASRTVSASNVLSLLEAARLAPSSYNLQPWRFLWTLREDPEFQYVLLALDPGNVSWASAASAFVVGTFTRAGRGSRTNPHAEHDLGIATAQWVLQAVSSGLAVHSMAGFDRDRLRAALGIPQDLEPMTVTAVGWPVEEQLPPQQRLALDRIAVRGRWPEEGNR